jgi:TolA-binding protein
VAQLQSDVDRLSASLADLRSSQAEQLADLGSLKSDVRTLSGRLDELEHSQKVGLGSDLNAVRQDLNALKSRVPPPAIVPSEALDEDQGRGADLPQGIGPKFENALQNIREGQFSVAQGLLEESLDGVYGTGAAPMVLFWLGVSEEGLNQNEKAVKHYAEIITRYPKYRRAALAHLRQASVLIRLGDKKTASLTLKKLINDFPKSTEAARAKERLKDL